MPRLPRLVASVAIATFALFGQVTSARADTPNIAPASSVTAAVPARIALTATTGTTMGSLMVVLDVLGIIEKDAPKTTATARAVRTPTFLSPEPPKTPLIYSSLVVAKF